MIVTLTLYYDTKWNITDCPTTQALLESGSSQKSWEITTLNDAYELDRIIRVYQAPSSIISSAKFAKLSDSRYIYDVIGYRWLNSTTAELHLELNPFLTPGVTISGLTTRITPITDTYGENMLPEPFTPHRPLTYKRVTMTGSNALLTGELFPADTNVRPGGSFLGSTINIPESTAFGGRTSRFSYDADGNISTIIEDAPNVRVAESSTINGLKVGYRIFNANNEDVKKGLNALNAYGVSDCVVARWLIPSPYCVEGRLDTVSGFNSLIVTTLTFTANVPTVRRNNLKASYLYQTADLMCRASGDSKTFRVPDIASDGVIGISVTADLSPQGRPYAYPTTIHGESGIGGLYAVSGREWEHPGLTLTGASGSALASLEANRTIRNVNNEQRDHNVSLATSAISTAVKVGTGGYSGALSSAQPLLSSGAQAIANGLSGQGYVDSATRNLNIAKEDAQDNEFIALNAYTPTYAPSSSGSLASNKFELIISNISAFDGMELDDFLSMYGYAANEVLTDTTASNISARGTSFGYVKMSSVNCKSSGSRDVLGTKVYTPLGSETIANERLRNGVRFWHTAYSTDALQSNHCAN